MAYSNVYQGFVLESSLLDNTDGSSYNLSTMIDSIMVKDNYGENSFPLFVINFKTTETIRNIIRDDDVEISLKVSAYNMENNENQTEAEDNSDVIISDELFQTVIRPYDKPFVTTAAKTEDEDKNDGETTQSSSAPFIYYQISGIPKDLITCNSSIVNKVYENATMNDMLINIISDVNKNTLVMQDSDNKEKYESVLIPPLNIIPAVRYLDTYYGIYSNAYQMFFDIDKTYLYSPFNNTLKTNTFNINVMSINNTTATNKYLTPMLDENDNVKIVLQNAPNVTIQEKIVGDNVGKNSVFYSYDDNYNIVKRSKSYDSAFDKTRYFWNTGKKKFFEDEYHTLLSKAGVMNIQFSNISPKYFNPDTYIQLSSDYSNINGDYILVDKSYILSTTDLKHYKATISLAMIKK